MNERKGFQKPITGMDASGILLFAIVLLLVLGITFAVYSLRPDPIAEFISEDRVISVMYVFEEDGAPLTTFVVLYYPITRRTAVFDVPGDLGMLIRRINRFDRIDTVYDSGRTDTFRELVAGILGIEIGFSVHIDVADLPAYVDLLEGLDLFVPTRIDFRDEAGNRVLLPAGVHRFSGAKAAVYMTHVLPGEERELVSDRRQNFFRAFLQRQAALNESLKSPAAGRLLRGYARMGLNQRARNRLFDELARMDPDRVGVYSVGGTPREVSGQTLLIPLHEGHLARDVVRRALASITRTEPDDSRSLTVEVLNGTTTAGLAGRTAELLREFGYDIVFFGNAEHSGFERTVIIDRSGNEALARNFAGTIRSDNIVFEPAYLPGTGQGGDSRSDITLIIGRDFNGRFVVGN
ncbi:MAG: LytR C-terminal domain-containing protein [Treponema sp.]|nr:LytR C-terminal domain-containing protein [Treponema sp.]